MSARKREALRTLIVMSAASLIMWLVFGRDLLTLLLALVVAFVLWEVCAIFVVPQVTRHLRARRLD